jgi:hypothetical protein
MTEGILKCNECEYIHRKECEAYRKEQDALIAKNSTEITVIKTKLSFFERMVWAIFSVLVAGFAGTIFAVLSLGK